MPHGIPVALDLDTLMVHVLYGAVMCLVRMSALIVSVGAGGCPGIFGGNLFVEQLLPGLDPVAQGHVGVLPIGAVGNRSGQPWPVQRQESATGGGDRNEDLLAV